MFFVVGVLVPSILLPDASKFVPSQINAASLGIIPPGKEEAQKRRCKIKVLLPLIKDNYN